MALLLARMPVKTGSYGMEEPVQNSTCKKSAANSSALAGLVFGNDPETPRRMAPRIPVPKYGIRSFHRLHLMKPANLRLE